MKRKILFAYALSALVLGACSTPKSIMKSSEVMTKEKQTSATPDDALKKLKEGNERFSQGIITPYDYLKQVKATADGQYPFASIVSCVDSRTSSEILFDRGLGDIFNARIAGNFITPEVLGSLEFTCKVAGSKLILVVGHSSCGAIKGACDNVQLGNLTTVINEIKPAVLAVNNVSGERNSKNHDFVEAVSKQNVLLAVKEIREKSPILKEMEEKGQIKIVGAMYNLETGKVTYYE